MDEWKEARSVLARYDTNLHDLRKYGFGFVTALLAANGLLSQGGTSVVPLGVKAAILVATMGLIVALKLLDTHYRLFQKAASIRGRILEDRLNLDITNDISFFYGLEAWWWYVQVLYYAFVGLTFVLGLAILWGNALLIIGMLVAALVSCWLIWFINREKPTALEDWSVDNKIVSQGTPVRITYTNLNSGDRGDHPGKLRLWWNVKREAAMTEAAFVKEESPVEVQLRYFENYDWLWETKEVNPGLYELAMFSPPIVQRGREALRMLVARIDAPAAWGPSSRLTIQVTKAKPEEPVKVVLEKTGEKTGHS